MSYDVFVSRSATLSLYVTFITVSPCYICYTVSQWRMLSNCVTLLYIESFHATVSHFVTVFARCHTVLHTASLCYSVANYCRMAHYGARCYNIVCYITGTLCHSVLQC